MEEVCVCGRGGVADYGFDLSGTISTHDSVRKKSEFYIHKKVR